MSLPRPVRTVLRDDANDQAVVRTWVRLQKTRQASRKVLPLAVAGLVLAGLTAVVCWPEPSPAPSASVLLARGRQQTTTRAQTTRVLSTQVVADARSVRPPPDVVGALLDAAAEALRTGHPERAEALLSEVARHHEGDPRAPTALIALGRIQLDALHRPADAVVSLTHALELNPPEDLVVSTWKSLEEARRAAGERDPGSFPP